MLTIKHQFTIKQYVFRTCLKVNRYLSQRRNTEILLIRWMRISSAQFFMIIYS